MSWRGLFLRHVAEDLDLTDLGIDDWGEPMVAGDLFTGMQRPQERTGVHDVDPLTREALPHEARLNLPALGQRRIDQIASPGEKVIDLLLTVANENQLSRVVDIGEERGVERPPGANRGLLVTHDGSP